MLIEASTRGILGLGVVANSALMTAVLLGGVYSSGAGRRTLAVGIAIGVPTVALQWIASYTELRVVDIANLVSVSLLILYTSVAVLGQIFRAKAIVVDTILGAIAVYLLVGIFFLLVASLIELLQPGSYSGLPASHGVGNQTSTSLLYFSFVTLTTLGYGDILPLSELARTAAYAEAVVGQLYLTVLIAWLVGVHISQSRRPD